MGSTNIAQLNRYLGVVGRYPRRKRALCIGDSWFQYPLRSYADLQRRLALPSEFGTRINFVDDSYPGRDADEVQGLYKRWLRLARTLQEEFQPFDLFLVSLGGNDIVGLDFIRHLSSGTGQDNSPWPWSDKVPAEARRWMDVSALKSTFENTIRAYGWIVAVRDEFAPQATIITHTYADVTPMDKPYKFLTYKSGPWIWKPATEKGIPLAEQKVIVRWLLESFAGMLAAIRASTKTPGRFVILDSRLELSDTRAWDNEIHPLGPGFRYLVENYWRGAIEKAIA